MDKKETVGPVNEAIAEALFKIKKDSQEKSGVSLLDITKKLSAKKFGKK